MSHDAYAAPVPEAFDELDPHGFDKGHHDHGHVIVGPFTLRSVLAILLFFTVLTVFLAQAEVWAQGYFHIELPWWVNVVGAMSIAVVKALLVMGFFMQLKYDNPINTVLMCFCFAALTIFLGFTGMDLFNRGAVDPQKQSQVIPGGTGFGVAGADSKPMVTGAADRLIEYLAVTGTLEESATQATQSPSGASAAKTLHDLASVVRNAHRQDALKYATETLQSEIKTDSNNGDRSSADLLTKAAAALKSDTPEARIAFEEMRETMHRAHGGHEEVAETNSSPYQSRPKVGLSNALSATDAPAKEEHKGETKAEEKHADAR